MRATRFAILLCALVGLVGVAGVFRAGPLDAELRGATVLARLGGKDIGTRVARRTMKQLDLSPGQRERAWDVIEAYLPRLDASRESIQSVGFDLLELDPDRADYPAAVEAGARGSAEQVAELVRLTGRMRAELYAILTPQQKRQAIEMSGELREQLEALVTALGPRRAR